MEMDRKETSTYWSNRREALLSNRWARIPVRSRSSSCSRSSRSIAVVCCWEWWRCKTDRPAANLELYTYMHTYVYCVERFWVDFFPNSFTNKTRRSYRPLISNSMAASCLPNEFSATQTYRPLSAAFTLLMINFHFTDVSVYISSTLYLLKTMIVLLIENVLERVVRKIL